MIVVLNGKKKLKYYLYNIGYTEPGSDAGFFHVRKSFCILMKKLVCTF